MTNGSPLRPDLTQCPIYLDDFGVHSTLTHSNGLCNRSFHQHCWEPWITDFGTCVNCREKLCDHNDDILIQAVDFNYYERTRFINISYRQRNKPQNLSGQESLKYHVTSVLQQYRPLSDQKQYNSPYPSPFDESDVLRFWFARHRAEFCTAGVTKRWEELVECVGPQNATTELIISQL